MARNLKTEKDFLAFLGKAFKAADANGTVVSVQYLHDDWCPIYGPEATCCCSCHRIITQVKKDGSTKDLAIWKGGGDFDPVVDPQRVFKGHERGGVGNDLWTVETPREFWGQRL